MPLFLGQGQTSTRFQGTNSNDFLKCGNLPFTLKQLLRTHGRAAMARLAPSGTFFRRFGSSPSYRRFLSPTTLASSALQIRPRRSTVSALHFLVDQGAQSDWPEIDERFAINEKSRRLLDVQGRQIPCVLNKQ